MATLSLHGGESLCAESDARYCAEVVAEVTYLHVLVIGVACLLT